MNYLTQTNRRLISLSVLLIRGITGVVLFMTGAGKVLSWFGGFGMEMTIKYYAMSGINVPFTYLSAYTEFIGGFLILIGFLTRPAAFLLLINMLVATIVSWPRGFLVGAAFPLSYFISVLALLLTGPMEFSLDHFVFDRHTRRVR